MPVICACAHCGEFYGSNSGVCARLCKNCKTADQRKALDAENLELNPNFVCEYCTRVGKKIRPIL